MYSAVPFYELLSACSQAFKAKPIDDYCLAKRAALVGKTMPPSSNPRSIRSTLKYGYLIDRRQLQTIIIDQLMEKGVTVVYPDCTFGNGEQMPARDVFDSVFQGLNRRYSCSRKVFVYSSSRFHPDSQKRFYHVAQGSGKEGGGENGARWIDYLGAGRNWLKRSSLGDQSVLEIVANSHSECDDLAKKYSSFPHKGESGSTVIGSNPVVNSLPDGGQSNGSGPCYFGVPVPDQPMIHLSDLDVVISQLFDISGYLFSGGDDSRLSELWDKQVGSVRDKFVRFNQLLISIKDNNPEAGYCTDPKSTRLINDYRQRGLLPDIESYPVSRNEMGVLLYGLLGPSRYTNPLVSALSDKPGRFLEAIDRAISKEL